MPDGYHLFKHLHKLYICYYSIQNQVVNLTWGYYYFTYIQIYSGKGVNYVSIS